MAGGIPSWSAQYNGRRAIAARFGSVFALPVVKRIRDLLVPQAFDGAKVLEVGAGDRSKGWMLQSRFPNLVYESLDIDVCGEHDYQDWSQVHRQFDVIFALEVVEHISGDELPGWFGEVACHLKPGGLFVCSTPNIFYPPDYLRDITHRTPLCFDELGALAEAAGLQVTHIGRVYNDPLHRILFKRYLFGWLFRMLGIDFARQIVLTARSTAETKNALPSPNDPPFTAAQRHVVSNSSNNSNPKLSVPVMEA